MLLFFCLSFLLVNNMSHLFWFRSFVPRRRNLLSLAQQEQKQHHSRPSVCLLCLVFVEHFAFVAYNLRPRKKVAKPTELHLHDVKAPVGNVKDQEADGEDHPGIFVNDVNVLDSRQRRLDGGRALFERVDQPATGGLLRRA